MRPNRIELALDGLPFYFDKAVEIIRRDVNETLSSLVHEINRVRMEFPRDDLQTNPPDLIEVWRLT